MKKRLKSLITSIFGALIMLIDLILILKAVFAKDLQILAQDVIIWCLIGCVGYIFLMAKDSLIEGITLGLIKPKNE